MPKIFDVPIEPFESRYSNQWRKWFSKFYEDALIVSHRITGATITKDIETGSFLDVHGTNFYKASQLQNLIVLLKTGAIRNGDWVFFHDLWFPGLEMLAYIRDASGIRFKIAGCLHAGGWDPNDFVTQKMRKMWTFPFEEMLFGIADKIFLATNFHKGLIYSYFSRVLPYFEEECKSKIEVTGFPIFPDECSAKRSRVWPKGITGPTGPLVVFPHRLDPEKDPGSFDELSRRPELQGFRFVKTKDVCFNKRDYYGLLSQADYAVSFAHQETWGIAMQEAAFSGAITFVPNRLSYREMYNPYLRYENMTHLVDLLDLCGRGKGSGKEAILAAQKETNTMLQASGAAAIPLMMRHMELI